MNVYIYECVVHRIYSIFPTILISLSNMVCSSPFEWLASDPWIVGSSCFEIKHKKSKTLSASTGRLYNLHWLHKYNKIDEVI